MNPFDFLKLVGHLRFAPLSQIEAAETQIDRAIDLHLKDREYISAITLACAAESIVGEHLSRKGQEHFSASLTGLLAKMGAVIASKDLNDQYIRGAQTFLTHAQGNLDDTRWFALEHESGMAIVRATVNFILLTGKATNKTAEFFEWFRENKKDVNEAASQIALSQRAPAD